jgi:hypothetical protein
MQTLWIVGPRGAILAAGDGSGSADWFGGVRDGMGGLRSTTCPCLGRPAGLGEALAVDQDRLQVNPGNALRYEPQFRFGMREQ